MEQYKKIINNHLTLVKNKVDVGELYIMGEISDTKWFEDDVTPKEIKDALDDMGDINTLEMFITSGGGSIIAGTAIFNLLESYKTKNNVKIEAYISFAASMATGIAMVADSVKMYENALFMIHKPLMMAYGNADDMRKNAEVLDVAENALITNYKRNGRFKGSDEELANLLAEETWLTAADAKEWGFVDEVIEPIQVAAKADGVFVNNVYFEKSKLVDIIKNRMNVESEVGMKYDASLLDNYGVTQEAFDAFDDAGALATFISAKCSADFEATMQETIAELESKKETPFIQSKDSLLEALGVEDITETELLDLAVKGKNTPDVDPLMEDKATQFDAIKKDKIADTLADGIRANGAESFNEKTWQPVLENMTYKQIVDVQNTWINQAKIALKAGTKVSETEAKLDNQNKVSFIKNNKGGKK